MHRTLHCNRKRRWGSGQLGCALFALALVLLLSTPVSSAPAAAVKSKRQSKPKIWGVIPKIEAPASSLKSRSTVPKHVIVMGGPASGKGTQCQAIAEKYGLVHLSTGDMLRQAVSSTVGGDMAPHIKTIKTCMENGKLVPDDMIVRLVLDRLRSSDCQERGWILDGFPRTANQARALQRAGIDPDLFVFLSVPDEVAIQRVCGRRTDPLTGRVYHVDFNPPPSDIASRLVVRSDDTVESMTQRLKQFKQNAAAVKDCFRSVVEIDGTGRPDEVLRDVLSSLTLAVAA